ncbi:DUF5675 family protein [Spirosoma sp. KNUC1025]|uniref:DUF5675 family protein n=1 Tax=Spirosoma sp. KNUC1025 TaxID=2894082 RepID=UPI00386B7369|nr:DUF5675 family protein [Spirosoma sp. KNUC1025]
MELEFTLIRTYYPTGTNGTISLNSGFVCHSIELPWKNNQRKSSCIPEGRYLLTRYTSPKHGACLLLNGVPGRGMVEIHEANWAVKQLEGCIAPVTTLDSPGVGWRSGDATTKLEGLAFPVLDRGGKVWLTIKGNQDNYQLG